MEERHPDQKAKELPNISARVAAAKRYEPGYWAFLLDDGAIWESTEITPDFHAPEHGDTVKIRHGVMGGFMLDFGRQTSLRVRRVS